MDHDHDNVRDDVDQPAPAAPPTHLHTSSFVPLRASAWHIAFAATLPLVAIVIAKIWGNVPVGSLTRDPSAIFNAPPLSGALSQLGGMIWAAATTLWLTMSVLTRQVDAATSRFALAMAGLTTYLALDDMFLLHETVLPDAIGIPEKVVLAAIAAAALVNAVIFRHLLAQHRLDLVVLAVGLLAGSVVLDVLDGLDVIPENHITTLAEDGLKWLGICSWCAYAFSWLCRSVAYPK